MHSFPAACYIHVICTGSPTAEAEMSDVRTIASWAKAEEADSARGRSVVEVQSVAVEKWGAFVVKLLVHSEDGDGDSGFGADGANGAPPPLVFFINFVAVHVLIYEIIFVLRRVRFYVEVDGAAGAEEVAPNLNAKFAGQGEKRRRRRHVVLVHCRLFEFPLLK